MLPFEAPTIFEQLPKFFFNVPRVVPDQKVKFETDETFRRLSRESEIRFLAYKDRPLAERRIRFQNGCREGHSEVVFINTGTSMHLVFNSLVNGYPDFCDFEKERGKVHFRSGFIMNGVCARVRGWVDLERLDGVAAVEYDAERGAIEDAILKDQTERYKARLREFQQRHGLYKADKAEEPGKGHQGHPHQPETTTSLHQANGKEKIQAQAQTTTVLPKRQKTES